MRINKIKSNMINDNNCNVNFPNRIEKSNGRFRVSEFDENIRKNDSHNGDSFMQNHKLTFNTSFQFHYQLENFPRVKSHPNPDENNNNIQPEPVYLSLETNAKDFCCSSRNSKCLII